MKNKWVYVMAAFYIAAGLNHFVHPDIYMKIMPVWLSWQKALIMVSGALEISFGVLIIPNRTRVFAAWGIIGLLIAVFPANIQMMLNYRSENHSGLWLTILRLPVQFLLIWWAWCFTKPATSIKP